MVHVDDFVLAVYALGASASTTDALPSPAVRHMRIYMETPFGTRAARSISQLVWKQRSHLA
jgi:hypothetical protein